MTPLLLSLALLIPHAEPATPAAGVLPLNAQKKPLNFDFETGTLQDWILEGEAFQGQPIQGDTVRVRRGDMKSGHQGKYWIGGYEKLQDKPKGTLTSVPFTVTHPWCSFLVGGGPHAQQTCVEIRDAKTKQVLFSTPGTEDELLQRVAFDLTKHLGQEIQIRLVDDHAGHWGHINFDDFRFHSEKPTLALRDAPPADPYRFAGQKPADAAKNMTVPPGFAVNVIAAEPNLHQPIAFCWDDRGRLWVVEAYVYPKRNPEKGPLLAEKKLGDKILIFEDTNGDGTFDSRKVFLEGLNLVSGIEYGFGGIWVGAAPYLMFIPIDASGDQPAGEPKILLDGWGYQDTHETLNSFIWGPDGWLYGCHGVFTHSLVGKPGTPEKDRIKLNAGIWRYHPTQHVFEVFAHGTSNPWGLDYNQYGDFFIEACVIPHLWHIVQEGRYERQAGTHFNPYTFDAQIKTIAKHRHYVGNQWNNRDRAKSDDLGGGHAHSGLMCYQGGAWPKEYHGKLFMGNIHGHRINVDEVKPRGASYEGDRNPDFLLSHDKTCIIVAIHAGPDGNVYFCDWSDKQVCHTGNPEIWDRTNGRLYRIAYKNAQPLKPFDLQKAPDAELVKLIVHENEWMSRHARRILQERAAEHKLEAETVRSIEEFATRHTEAKARLRGLWTLHTVGGLTLERAKLFTTDTNAHVRAWLVQLTMEGRTDSGEMSPVFRRWAEDKKTDPVVVRSLIAASMRYTNTGYRLSLVRDLARGATMAEDPILPQLYWYAVEPLLTTYPSLLSELGLTAKVPKLLEFMTRRVAAIGTENAIAEIVAAMARTDDALAQKALLEGFTTALKGTTVTKAPRNWSTAYLKLSQSNDPAIRQAALGLGLKFGDIGAQKVFRDILRDQKAERIARLNALAVLVENKDTGLPAVIDELLTEVTDAELRSGLIRAIAVFGNRLPIATLCRIYPNLTPGEKRDAIATLASRPQFAEQLLMEVEQKRIPPQDLPAEALRQLRSFNDKALSAKLAAVWGVVRDTPAERAKLIADWKQKLTPKVLASADLGAGRAVFNRVCQQCHTLYGVGGKVGPEITGANRSDLNYLLENIFDPSAVIPKEYASTQLDLEDGRVITGIVKEENPSTLTVVTANETLTIPTADIARRTPSTLSMMPDDLTKQLSEASIRDLIAYLKQTSQVPVLADKNNAKEFFNGKDLNGWDGDKDVWSVDNGELVGKSTTGLKRNNFIKSTMDVTDFKLSVKVKLIPNEANSGIQFRSVPIEGGEMRGPQADIGKGWWGKLYEESARGLLVKGDNEKLVKPEEWNEYVIQAVGPVVTMWLNGEKVVEYKDEKLARRGIIAFQVHSGGPTEVRFKEIRLEVLPADKK